MKKQRRFNLRCNDSQYAEIKTRARLNKKSVNDFLISQALKKRDAKKVIRILDKTR